MPAVVVPLVGAVEAVSPITLSLAATLLDNTPTVGVGVGVVVVPPPIALVPLAKSVANLVI